jgi:hypothetical protein
MGTTKHELGKPLLLIQTICCLYNPQLSGKVSGKVKEPTASLNQN